MARDAAITSRQYDANSIGYTHPRARQVQSGMAGSPVAVQTYVVLRVALLLSVHRLTTLIVHHPLTLSL